jgi:Serine phosphatase RsbU, regulator of sigma subunit
LEAGSRYVTGAHGIDVGGDWYSLIAVDDTHFGFVVGDVSGRGISAAGIMAQLRFTMRAYLLEGHSPDVVLTMCSHQLDIAKDGHFATALVGLGDLESGEIVLASAGHFEPLIVSGSRSHYVVTEVGTPLGVEPATYASTKVVLAPGSMLVAFTDGLVERRGENIDVGLHRLAQAATPPATTIDDFLTGLVRELTNDDSEDDVAVLAFRRHDRDRP